MSQTNDGDFIDLTPSENSLFIYKTKMTYCNTERRPRKKLWATSSKHDLTSWLWLVSILWPRRLRCCDRHMTTAINTSLSFYLRVSKNAGKLLHIYMFTKAKHKNQNGCSQLWTSSRISYSISPGYRPKVYIVHLSELYICIFCPVCPRL